MIKPFLILTIVVLFFAACKKSSVQPKQIISSTANSYFPITAGSSWTYKTNYAGPTAPDTLAHTITMSADTSMINGKIYHNILTDDSPPAIYGYLYEDNHTYALRQVKKTGDLALEYQFLIDTASAGYTWTTNTNETGNFAGGPSRVINSIVETNISKTVRGTTFKNVIHTHTQLQFASTPSTPFYDAEYHDFYFAKGVGMIEDDQGMPDVTLHEVQLQHEVQLVSFVIK